MRHAGVESESMTDGPRDQKSEISHDTEHEISPASTARPRGFEVRTDVMEAQAAYVARGLTGPSPDKDMWLIPEAVRPMMRRGFVPEGVWVPTFEEAAAMTMDDLHAAQGYANTSKPDPA